MVNRDRRIYSLFVVSIREFSNIDEHDDTKKY